MKGKANTEEMRKPDVTQPVVRLENLGELIRRKRKEQELTLEEAATKVGISAATLSRLERQMSRANMMGSDRTTPVPDTRTLAAVTRWLGVSIERVTNFEMPQAVEGVVHHEGETTPDMVEAHLRADKNIDPDTAAALSRLFRVAYEQFALLPGNANQKNANRE